MKYHKPSSQDAIGIPIWFVNVTPFTINVLHWNVIPFFQIGIPIASWELA